MSKIRAFIALELSDEARAVLAAVSEALAQEVTAGAVKWVQPERMHLTLRFLGNTALERVDDVAAALDGVAARHEPFGLTLDALGCFPYERKPRVIWVGVQGDIARAEALQASLDDALQGLGWEPEGKPFRPHVTLGRVKEQQAKIRLPWGNGVAPARTQISDVVLFESQLRRDGPRYIARHTSRLGKEKRA